MVNASFSEASYIVSESEGSVEVCLVLEGIIQKDVILLVEAINGSATGRNKRY